MKCTDESECEHPDECIRLGRACEQEFAPGELGQLLIKQKASNVRNRRRRKIRKAERAVINAAMSGSLELIAAAVEDLQRLRGEQ